MAVQFDIWMEPDLEISYSLNKVALKFLMERMLKKGGVLGNKGKYIFFDFIKNSFVC